MKKIKGFNLRAYHGWRYPDIFKDCEFYVTFEDWLKTLN